MATDEPRTVLAQAPMSRARITGVVLCVTLTALDGFDVLSIGFASPGIAKDWVSSAQHWASFYRWS